MLARERAAVQNALQRLGHIEPGTGQRGIERQDAVLEQPADQVVAQVPRQIVPHHQQPESRGQLGPLIGPPPVLPGADQQMVCRQGGAHQKRLAIQLGEHLAELVFEPRVQHRVGGRKHSPGPHFAGRWAKERQQLGRSAAHVLVGLGGGMTRRMPGLSRLGNGLIGTGLVLAPQRHTAGFRRGVGRLDHPLFSPALGSWTVTGPPARLRTAVPVGHQVRVLPKR